MSDLLTVENQIAAAFGLAKLEPLKGGRTNRVWRSQDKVIKLFSEGAATPLFGNSAKDEWAALTALEGHNIAPDPVGEHQSAFGRIVIYRHIPGAVGVPKMAEAGRLLGRLHELDLPIALPVSQNIIEDGLAMLPAGHALARSKPMEIKVKCNSLVHRDPVFSNFISGPDGLRLVDWQCPAIGDPVEDIAHFISPAMNLLYRGKPLNFIEIGGFLESYPDRSAVQDHRDYGHAYHWRMACYCAWQVERGNADYVPALQAETEFLANLPL